MSTKPSVQHDGTPCKFRPVRKVIDQEPRVVQEILSHPQIPLEKLFKMITITANLET